jgi:hypothetical protein
MVGLIGLVSATVITAVLVMVAVMSNDPSVLDLEVGDCFELPIEGDDLEIDSVDVVGCGEPHDAEVVHTGSLNVDADRPYPSDDDLFAEVDDRCRDAQTDLVDEFGMLPVAPNEASWEPMEGRFICLAIPYGGGMVTGSIAHSETG